MIRSLLWYTGLTLVVMVVGWVVGVGYLSFTSGDYADKVIAEWYEPLIPIRIADIEVQASIASTPEERQQGLSGTPYLPETVVKLFVFPHDEYWSIWMPDMNYAIDILWVNKDGQIVHIAPVVAPETYPQTFVPDVPARYVIETAAGFTTRHTILVGDQVDLPAFD